MHINNIQHFDTIKMYILGNNMITLNIKQNRHPVVQLRKFSDFYIKPRLLINMHDITNKTNSAHLRPMDYQCTPHMMCILCIVIEISRPQASRNTHTPHTHILVNH